MRIERPSDPGPPPFGVGGGETFGGAVRTGKGPRLAEVRERPLRLDGLDAGPGPATWLKRSEVLGGRAACRPTGHDRAPKRSSCRFAAYERRVVPRTLPAPDEAALVHLTEQPGCQLGPAPRPPAVLGLVAEQAAGLVDREHRLERPRPRAARGLWVKLCTSSVIGVVITVSALAMMKTSAPFIGASSALRTAWAASLASM